MLVNVTHDRAFQDFLDREEDRLFNAIRPPIGTAMRMAMSRGTLPAQKYLIERGQAILVAHYKRIYRAMFNSVGEIVQKQDDEERARRRRAAILAAAGNTADTVSQFLDSQLDWLETEGATRIVGISETTLAEVRDIAMAGVAAGKSNDSIARELFDSIPDFSKFRAAVIARTETHTSALAAINETFRAKDIEVQTKTWWTAGDARVRDSHVDMHGVTIPYDDAFEVGDSLMLFPGDVSMGAGPEEIINCRCSVLYNTAPD